MRTNIDSSIKSYTVPAVDQAVRILLCLAKTETNSRSLTEICQEVGVHRSKAFSILNTLQEYGLVRKNPNRKGYVLGPGLLTLTGKMLESLHLPRLVEPVLYELAIKTESTVALHMLSDDKAFVVAQFEGAPGLGVSAPIGHVTPLTFGAHGIAIAACLPPAELADLLKAPKLYFHARPEKFDPVRFEKELAFSREHGYAMELGEVVPGINAIAAPMRDPTGHPIGFITIVGFFTEEMTHTLGPQAVEAAHKISRDTGQLMSWKRYMSGDNEV